MGNPYRSGLVFLPMADSFGAYNRYFGRLNTGEILIMCVIARKDDAPEYVRSMPSPKLFK